MTFARQRLGRTAEELVAARLERSGWRIVERNVRHPSGELDIVALDGGTLVFVEVKAGRAGATLGPERPAHAVGPRKQLSCGAWPASGSRSGVDPQASSATASTSSGSASARMASRMSITSARRSDPWSSSAGSPSSPSWE